MKYAVLMGSALLAERLFGADLHALSSVPGTRLGPVVTAFTDDVLERIHDAEVLVTGWGAPELTVEIIERLPNVDAIVHAGGYSPVPPAVRERRLMRVSIAADVNAVPVAEYTLAMILLANKEVFRSERLYRQHRRFIDREVAFPFAGNAYKTVGIVGASRIGRRVVELLRPFDLEIVLYDPYLSEVGAAELGVELVPLAELFKRSDVVSIHAPATPETHHLVGKSELASLSDGATIINTARGSLVDDEALLQQLISGRINAVLDVTDPAEPLPADSPFWDLPNVVLTPHMAGSTGTELLRIGKHVIAELRRVAVDESFATPA
ncbi:hydroxyacid dehydrogenase [Leifsonia shinshuensis]|uniref:hydroxyacid dehydrogenase n=1 Tax=Leifsonia shinshuensis TaxID=150026 RepID=UPI001CA54A85|nr:hydroxyacid dehydrogenase [Leifsonia shinshuensis]